MRRGVKMARPRNNIVYVAIPSYEMLPKVDYYIGVLARYFAYNNDERGLESFWRTIVAYRGTGWEWADWGKVQPTVKQLAAFVRRRMYEIQQKRDALHGGPFSRTGGSRRDNQKVKRAASKRFKEADKYGKK